ncbi:CBS domain-containing protein, partial [Streptomyces cyaneofuscatus]
AAGREASARDLARPVPELAPDATAAHAVERLRERRATIAVVRDEQGRLAGLVSLDDLLARLLHPPAAS